MNIRKVVMSLALALGAAMGSIVPKAYAFTATSYAKNGLVALYDGIENAGSGVAHASETDVWKDLSGNGYDATRGAGVVWEENCWTNNANGKPFTLPLDVSEVLKTGTFTIEFLVKPSRGNVRECFFSQYSPGFGMEHNSGSYSDGTLRLYWGGKPDIKATDCTVAANELAAITYTVKDGQHIVYKNGEQVFQKAAAIGSYPSDTTALVIGGENNRDYMAFRGWWYAMRIYDRALSPAEVLSNNKIDRARYMGESYGDQLAVVGAPFDFGTVSPAYGVKTGLSVGSETVCTALATAPSATGAYTMRCTGYEVKVNGETYVKGSFAPGVEPRFTYVHPECDGAELTWFWEKVEESGAPMNVTGVSVTVDKVQQRYPWNGAVEIDYTVSYAANVPELVPGEDRIEFAAVDESVMPSVTNDVFWFDNQLVPMSAGTHHLTWYAPSNGCTAVSRDMHLLARVRHFAARYLVIDVSKGPEASEYPCTYLVGEPVGGFNTDEYKGDKIVLRRIPAGSFVMGDLPCELQRDKSNHVPHGVKLTQDFYIGIFELTQKQFENVLGADKNYSTQKGDFRPVETQYYPMRGEMNWPGVKSVGPDSFCGKLTARTGFADVGMTFDLPTEAQWEYACRAGTHTPYGNGVVITSDSGYNTEALKMARFSANTSDGRGVPEGESWTTHTTVGSYEPNLWGLYDMHGNLAEFCRDRGSFAHIETLESVDPVGYSGGNTGTHTTRGGGSDSGNTSTRAASRSLYCYTYTDSKPAAGKTYGARIVLITAP